MECHMEDWISPFWFWDLHSRLELGTTVPFSVWGKKWVWSENVTMGGEIHQNSVTKQCFRIMQMHTVKGLNSISAHSSIHRKVEYRKAMHQQNMSETPLKTITLVHLNLWE